MSKRPLSKYCEFIRDRYHTPSILKLPVRERIKELARQWRELKAKPAAKEEKPAAKKRKRKKRIVSSTKGDDGGSAAGM